ncbi:alpha/beta hydrolase family protein [Streptomyces albus]|uniref:alpha/beta hydrolase n=1 Tax=Streptomyces albus TaxID=1888 RepID=UPI0004C88B7E|nr:alpha/beta hydrolase-fold protein [Streptomyces albus]
MSRPSPRHRRTRRPLRTLAALTAGTALLATDALSAAGAMAGAPTASGFSRATTTAAASGARIVSERRLDARTLDLMVDSPAVGTTLPVRVVLPAGFETEPDRTWPVLYLLQGAHDDYTSWTRETDVEEFLADKDVIAVMPSSGPTGIPTAWWNYGRSSAPDYETFQVEEVMELLKLRYRASGTRAVAGVSTGGYGALAFAARRPGAFGAAASYSGIVDTTAPGMPAVLNAIVARESQPPLTLWGSPLLQRRLWNQHNPAAQARQLAGTRLYVSQGSGIPNTDFGNLEGALLEGTLWLQAKGFTKRLEWLGIPAETHLYSGGSHAWPYWQREFKASWPVLAAGLGLPPS